MISHALLVAGSDTAISMSNGTTSKEKGCSFLDLGPLKDGERRDLNCAIKEYLVFAGYRLTALTFYEEVGQIIYVHVHI